MKRAEQLERAQHQAGGPGNELGPADASGPEGRVDDPTSTRTRILDVALGLFVEQGFDATSLREIAERLGVTKAAIYYHFSSKDDILLALHLRLHEVGKDALRRIAAEPVITMELWAGLLDELMGQMLAQRELFLLHERNQAAFEKLHTKDHEAEHEDLQEAFHRLLADTNLPLRTRIRMACSFGAVFASLFMAGDAFATMSDDELGRELRAAVHDVLGS